MSPLTAWMVASPDIADVDSGARPEPGAPELELGREPWSERDFRALYDAHFKLVWCALRRLGVREADVMDLTQKVFLTAYRKLETFEGRAQITTWLFAICQRTASDYRRSAPVRREVATDATELDGHTRAPEDASAQLMARQRAELAEQILNKLPEAQRSVFVLFELEELSGPEIAEILQVSVGTVRSRLRLARETFAREVKRLNAQATIDAEGT